MEVSPIAQGLNKVIESKWMNKKFIAGLKDPAGFAAKTMVLSFITKDAVNCAIYTYQSANNQKIPEDKRKFVASLDLIQGFINVGGQFLAAKIFENKLVPKWFGKNYSGTFVDPLTKKEVEGIVTDTSKSRLLADNIRGVVKDVINKNTDSKNKKIVNKILSELKSKNIEITKLPAEETENVIKSLIENMAKGSKNFGSYDKGFKLLVGALATTALVKRTLNPLIATPLAGMLSDRWEKKRKPVKDRGYYEVKAVESGKYKNSKLDKTAFSNISSSSSSNN